MRGLNTISRPVGIIHPLVRSAHLKREPHQNKGYHEDVLVIEVYKNKKTRMLPV